MGSTPTSITLFPQNLKKLRLQDENKDLPLEERSHFDEAHARHEVEPETTAMKK
jgi:hypothetical protein